MTDAVERIAAVFEVSMCWCNWQWLRSLAYSSFTSSHATSSERALDPHTADR